MIHTVIFDLDGTLYDYDTANVRGLRALTDYAVRTLGIEREEFPALHKRAMKEQERRMGFSCGSIHNRIIRFQIILEWTGKPVSHALYMSNLFWDTFLDGIAPFHGVKDCLRTLREAGYRVGIGTNMTADYQFIKLDRLGLLEDIDFMLTSEEAGVEKPDPQFFARCLAKAECPAEACAFVGDNPVHDAEAAIAAGMKAVWFRPESSDQRSRALALGDRGRADASSVPDALCVSSMDQLPGLLAGL